MSAFEQLLFARYSSPRWRSIHSTMADALSKASSLPLASRIANCLLAFIVIAPSSTGGIRTHRHQGLSLAAMPFAYRAVCCRAARQGVEPRLTDSKSVVLSITLAGRNLENGSFSQCPSQESNLVLDLRMRRVRIRHTPRTCLLSIISSAGEIRTRRHWFLKPAAQPLAYRTR